MLQLVPAFAVVATCGKPPMPKSPKLSVGLSGCKSVTCGAPLTPFSTMPYAAAAPALPACGSTKGGAK